MNITMRTIILILTSLLLASGCASVPSSVSGENFAVLTPDQVRNNQDQANGASVRWGGIIVEVINNETETWLEILALPLSDSSKPVSDRQNSQGRFIAKTEQFLDPEIYQKGLRITFIGLVSSTLEGKVGERPYVYPVLNVQSHYLWPKRSYYPRRYISPGFWYYGFHPYWRFGYPFYGYGIWRYDISYPYYPVYGYLHRSNDPLPRHHISGDFSYSIGATWRRPHLTPWNTQRYRSINHHANQTNFRHNTRQNTDRATNRATRPSQPGRSLSNGRVMKPRQQATKPSRKQ